MTFARTLAALVLVAMGLPRPCLSQLPPLLAAAGAGDLEGVHLALKQGASVDERNPSDESALVVSAAEGHLDVVRLLLEKGASKRVHGAGRNALMSASARGQLSVVEFFLRSTPRHFELEIRDRQGRTALWFAAQRGQLAVAKLLRAAGADLESKTYARVSPLMVAAANGERGFCQWLLEQGDSKQMLSDRDVVGGTALVRAVVSGHADVVGLLIRSSADPRSRIGRLGTPRDIAQRLGHHRVAAVLTQTKELDSPVASGRSGKLRDSESLALAESTEASPSLGWTYREDVEYGPEAFGVEEFEPPKLVRQVAAAYTEDALIRRVEGQVGMEVVVLTTGRVGPIRIRSSLDPGLDMAAIEAVRQWVFQPAALRGELANIVVDIGVDFNVQGGERMRLMRKRR